MKTIKLSYYTDPAHGWVKVSKKVLFDLEISDKITRYSYMRGEYAYLEEDHDLSILINAYSKRGITIQFNQSNSNRDSKIRGYARYEYGF